LGFCSGGQRLGLVVVVVAVVSGGRGGLVAFVLAPAVDSVAVKVLR
jgi:predicted transcriptional regulator